MHDRCAMKVGTDGVLLGAWAKCENAKTICDVGTGSGLIALMLAQRNAKAKIDAIEIEMAAASQAAENFEQSNWASRLTAIHANVLAFRPAGQYDLIVSNPPFFEPGGLFKSPHRESARTTIELHLQGLVDFAVKYLATKGSLACILPFDQLPAMTDFVEQSSLSTWRITTVHGTPEKRNKRILMQLSKEYLHLEQSELVIEVGGRHKYSSEYKALTNKFYLEF